MTLSPHRRRDAGVRSGGGGLGRCLNCTLGVGVAHAVVSDGTKLNRAARAQLYWDLVQGCRDPRGALLPHDAVALSFNIDAEGYIVPSSIAA